MTQWLFLVETSLVKDALENLQALSLFLQRRDATAVSADSEVGVALRTLRSMRQADDPKSSPPSSPLVLSSPPSSPESPSSPLVLARILVTTLTLTTFPILANRKKCDLRKTGGGPPPPEYTVAEELALSSNKGRPIMDGIGTGAVQSDPGAGSSKQVTLGMCAMHYYLLKVLHVADCVFCSRGNTVSLLKPAHFHTVSHTEGEANDEDTLSVCSETIAEDFSQPAPQTDASTSMGFRRNVNKVETDSVRALYKRSLELDCTLKELDCELRSLKLKN
ncbi:hypothetical protein G5714_002483 [Onychostoma macrolepis]|uniref:Uncharacterized protein n=1 Tax=Onychostoma macrolepis TaxID=369639 RepID=A0A7J6DF74_9TELE|nr:hypothetical protein G5714_002483 [Onychostoma macrolepis]